MKIKLIKSILSFIFLFTIGYLFFTWNQNLDTTWQYKGNIKNTMIADAKELIKWNGNFNIKFLGFRNRHNTNQIKMPFSSEEKRNSFNQKIQSMGYRIIDLNNYYCKGNTILLFTIYDPTSNPHGSLTFIFFDENSAYNKCSDITA
ncbi:hypothetical protein LVJ83_04935 [Uruburuella testudinis]|uniref:DUF4830 domain-containing protein n=1 Tax=Uruburuella testudinis TaxID=1282863 RepID=A0ABY4DWF4_9NEIS|nr:hypothetical protein [Uruburuella testudinis]UOO82813.1 hypothetical protein LVJ83_04935 [Uruburuella testudinis]